MHSAAKFIALICLIATPAHAETGHITANVIAWPIANSDGFGTEYLGLNNFIIVGMGA